MPMAGPLTRRGGWWSRPPSLLACGSCLLSTRGVPGKGSAFRAIFETARALGAKACVVVDSDLRSITPDWIRLLAGPVLDGRFGYVAPYYVRHKYDGTITNSIAYPLTAALYGVAVRQPIGGDFGFSGRLLDCYLGQDVWETDVARFGVDIWMTTTALNEGFAVAQACLGAKLHDPKDPAASLGPMFRQVVGTLFGLDGAISAPGGNVVSGVQAAPLLGDAAAVEPEPVRVDVPALIERFRVAFAAEYPFWVDFVAEENLRVLDEINRLGPSEYRFPVELWVRLVYDFAVAYNRNGLDRNRVVDSLTGLYYGRTASFCLETAGMTTAEAERQVIGEVARRFVELKPYVESRWAAG